MDEDVVGDGWKVDVDIGLEVAEYGGMRVCEDDGGSTMAHRIWIRGGG